MNRYRVARGCLDCAGRRSVYPINPMAVARYRDRHSTAGRNPTRASGKAKAVLHRRVKSQRLAAAGYNWAFSAISAAPGARTHYDRRKADGTGTPPPSATSSGGSPAACTTAWPPASTTTKTPPSPAPPRRHATSQLDN